MTSDTDKTRLEDMHLRFARAVTGAKRGTSHRNIYNATCWLLLSDRRKNCKLKFMYKVMYHCAPPYLTDLIPNRVRDIIDHNLRNKDDFRDTVIDLGLKSISIAYSWMVSGCGITYLMTLKT